MILSSDNDYILIIPSLLFFVIKTLVEEYIYSGDQSDLMDGLENLDLSGIDVLFLIFAKILKKILEFFFTLSTN